MINQIFIIIFSFFTGYLIDNFLALMTKTIFRKEDKPVGFNIKYLRIHHSLVGYCLIILGIFINPLFIIPMGLGIIVGHKIRDDLFWFIEINKVRIKRLKKVMD